MVFWFGFFVFLFVLGVLGDFSFLGGVGGADV